MRLIDADALIAELNDSHFPGAPYVDAGISIAIGKICDAPTIEPERDEFPEECQKCVFSVFGIRETERKKGRWIKHVDDLFPAESTIECSECHHEQPIIIDDNFCPNCGTEMEEETE